MRRHLDNRYRLGRDRVNILKHGNTDISYEACVKAALLEHIVNQRGGCGFSLGACYAHLAARCKFQEQIGLARYKSAVFYINIQKCYAGGFHNYVEVV